MRRFVVGSSRRMRRSAVLQVGVVLVLWGMGEALVRAFGIPVPGGVAGSGIAIATANQVGSAEGSIAGPVMVFTGLLNVIGAGIFELLILHQ